MKFLNKTNYILTRLIISRHTLSIEETGRRKLFTFFLLLMILGLFVFGTSHLSKGLYKNGILNYSLVIILTLFVILVRYLKNASLIYRITTALFAAVLFYWVRTGGAQGYSSLWAFLFPLFSFFLLGKKEGFILSVTFLFTIIFLFINPFSLFSGYTYLPQFISRHIFLFTMILLFTYNYESIREKYKSAMEAEIRSKEQSEIELRRHRDHLEEIIAERTAEIEKSRDQLAESQKLEALGTLVGGLAHDFNNFLAGIIGSIDIVSTALKKEKLDNKEYVEKYLNIGMESTKRSAGLINQLLILSKKHEIKLSPLDIRNSLNHIYELCRNSFPKSIEILERTDETPLVIRGDMVQIEQVLLNLCINASHAMTIMRREGEKHGGTLTLTAGKVNSDYIMKENYPEETGMVDHWIRIKISDTGVGFDNDIKQRIFEPFFSTKAKIDGTGLGLSISYNIVKKHGGIINVYSEPGSGSCFSVYFPVYSSHVQLSPEKETVETIKGNGKILIIDDEAVILEIAGGFLRECGYDVLTAEGPDRGIEIYSKESSQISAVLIDLSMPGKSGLEVFRELKKINGSVKAVLSSGMLDDETKEEAFRMGIKYTADKPYSAYELSMIIKTVIEDTRTTKKKRI